MPKRVLYLAAYDVSEPARLRQALHVVKGYATGGQKSVYECFLTDGEREDLLDRVRGVIDIDEDRFMLLRVETRTPVRTIGIAVPPNDPAFYYVG
jgi:CRISPR-associated protein Cas2